ncbi:MAG: SRPBCC family protein [Saccharolobus sp.]
MFVFISTLIKYYLMIEFRVEKPFTLPSSIVWEIVRDVNSIPNYWKGTRELDVKEIKEGVYEGTVRFAVPMRGKVRITVSDNDKILLFDYLKGPIIGYNKVSVGENKIVSEWKVRMTGLLKIMDKWNSKHFMEGTQNALERIIQEARNRINKNY